MKMEDIRKEVPKKAKQMMNEEERETRDGECLAECLSVNK